MILVTNIGNTNIDVGVYQDRVKLTQFQFHSDRKKSSSEYHSLFDSFLKYHNIDKNKLEGGIISSVVPNLTTIVKLAIQKLLNKECLVVNKSLKSGLSIQIDNPSELGADLLCQGVACFNNYQDNCLIINLGNVNKILVIGKDKSYKGGIFFPGINLQKESLAKAALLHDVELNHSENLICKSTQEAVCNGIVNEIIFAVNGFIKNIEKQTNLTYTKILTGEDSNLFKSYFKDCIYNPDLILEGLYDIYMKNRPLSK